MRHVVLRCARCRGWILPVACEVTVLCPRCGGRADAARYLLEVRHATLKDHFVLIRPDHDSHAT